MKKLLALVVAMLMVVSCAVAEESVGLANPMTEAESLEELNELVGCNLVQPGVMGVSEETYFTIDCGDYLIAEYNFAINGRPFTMRAAAVLDDISGVYFDGEPAFTEWEYETTSGYESIWTDDVMVARWFTIDGQYCISCFDVSELDGETFETIAEELRELTDPAMTDTELEAYYLSIEGEYQDKVSQRATMTITAVGSTCASAVVTWADDAETTESWEMELYIMEDGLLTYANGIYSVNGEMQDFGLEGYFVPLEDGSIDWSGAPDTNCASCVFERIG